MPPLPTEFIENMRKMLGDETPAFLRALEDAPALALRLNPKRAHAEDAAAPFIDGPVVRNLEALNALLESDEFASH